jgi:hypothetical protein
LLSLLDALLTPLDARFDLFRLRRSRAHSGRSARPQWRGDARLRAARHGRSLRRRRTMNLGSWACNARWGRSRRCGDTRRRMRGHGWTLWRGSRTERRCGRSRHWRRCRWASHSGWGSRWSGDGRWWSRGSGCCGRATWAPATRTSSRLGGRVGAHRDRGDTKKKSCEADAARTHGLNSLLPRRPKTLTRRRWNRCFGLMTCIAILRCGTGAIRLQP